MGERHQVRDISLRALDKSLRPKTITACREAVAGAIDVGCAVQITSGGDFDAEFGEGVGSTMQNP